MIEISIMGGYTDYYVQTYHHLAISSDCHND